MAGFTVQSVQFVLWFGLSTSRSPMRFLLTFCCLLAANLFTACRETPSAARTAASRPAADSTKPTAIAFDGQSYGLLRYGRPYFIKGAGYLPGPGDNGRFDRLRECGGNSIRTWDDLDAGRILDQAGQLGLTVMLGLWVEREAEGFDYHDRAAIDKQLARIRRTVLRYRHHPALLMWCVGNEWAQYADTFDVYGEVDRIAALVQELDPDHPVATAISPDSDRAVWLTRENLPHIDILAFNTYNEIPQLEGFMRKGGWTGPYLLSEFGAEGYWQTTQTPWKTPIEQNSRQKNDFVRQTYQKYIDSRPPNCLGSYMFIWGTKQEETHTWFSFFDEQGREYPIVGLMQQLWTGQPPANQAPVIDRLRVDGYDTTSLSFSFSPAVHRAQILAIDPDGDPLTYRWEIKPSAQQTADYVGTPLPAIDGLIHHDTAPTTPFSLPQKPGAYRLFVYVYDNHRHVASANFSFRITPPGETPGSN